MQLTEKVQRFTDLHQLLTKDEKILVGVSGGADSMALLHILRSLGYRCMAAHCNFHLRGDESDRDEKFVREYCLKNNIEFISVSFDTFGYMKQQSVSLEMAARELRYEWFEESRIKYNAHKIAIAHNQDDSVETFLINLLRGTGIKGLTGIRPNNGTIIRPLLDISRDEIEDYLLNNQIPYVTDSTNNEDIYIRNKLRLKIIPLLEDINPSVKQTIYQTSCYLSETEKVYNEYIAKLKEEVFKNNRINIELLQRTGHAKTLLFEILHPFGFNAATIENISDSVEAEAGKKFYSDSHILVKDRGYFLLDRITPSDESRFFIEEGITEIHSPIKMNIEYFNKSDHFIIEKNKNLLYADKSKISFPFIIRRWKQGDRFVPFGMKGSKKLSDYFTDNKFSLLDKENVWLLCDAKDTILWIIGERADERFKISANTDEILKIRFINI